MVVQDDLTPCPYREDFTARMPLQLPVEKVTPIAKDRLLEAGYRRSGDYLYRTQCPNCRECRPTRILVNQFRATSSMRRVLNRGRRELRWAWGETTVDPERVELFNRHLEDRGLGSGCDAIDSNSYQAFLVDSCCETRELAVYLHQKLVAVSVVDIGAESTSAVYTFFAPEASRYSLGTFAILQQIHLARQTGRKYVYLGMYVAANRHLNYKARFLPQQRLITNHWVDFPETK